MLKKIFGYLLLVFLAVAIYFGTLNYYQFHIKPDKELQAFNGDNFDYNFKDGQLYISNNRFRDFKVVNDSLFYDSNSLRKIISLNGIWQIAEGNLNEIPSTFPNTVPVPGFADLATPEFENVGKIKKQIFGLKSFIYPSQFRTIFKFKDEKREAFWYKKSFVINGNIPAFAQLKVHKAMYGSEVWLNGTKLGENGRNYQPGYYNVSEVIKGNGQNNELIIRVGTSISYSHNNQNVYGDVIEKNKKTPGIYDNVELMLSGAIQIEKVQVVPDVKNKSARVIAWVNNNGEATTTSLKFNVKKYQSDSIVGAVQTASISLKENESKLVEVVIPIKDCKLWSPENPNLYALTTKSDNDQLETRFGMREFHFDKSTKVGTLNNKPYYIRGTSVPFFRYIDNPYRKDEVWNEDWVRTVFKRFKEMNWNTVRFHIGQAPSMWYRIADEEGMIIQDEYAVWGYNLFRMGIPLETLVGEYVGWMEEQWNHASVLIWDAQNETTDGADPRPGMALNIVRTIDELNRPWDNGWGKPQSETDTQEMHPYIFQSAMFNPFGDDLEPLPTLVGFNKTKPDSILIANNGKNPALVNEYTWLWVRRDGKAPKTTQAGFAKYFPNATPKENFERYAYNCAAQTEYYRALRSAGVMQFAGLNSSYVGCGTTDIFSEIETLTIEPFIKEYVKDAFSPVGVCIFDWSDTFSQGAKQNVPIVIVNDNYEEWKGNITVELRNQNDELVNSYIIVGEVEATGKGIFQSEISMPNETGNYVLKAKITNLKGQEVTSFRKFEII